MTRRQFVFRNALRNPRRTILTSGSVGISVFLLAIFLATYRYLNAPPATDRTDLVLVVSARTAATNSMPLSYRHEIEGFQGVAAVSPVFFFDARYKSKSNIIPALACDPEKILLMLSDWNVPEDQRRTFIAEEDAVIAGRQVAEKYGWKIGDRILVSSPNYQNVPLELVLRAVYSGSSDEGMLAFHWSYLNETLGRRNTAATFWVLARSADDISHLTREIDAHFRNSPVETRTQTLKQAALRFLSLLGNVKRILMIVIGAVVFAVLLVVANTMAMSIRERTTEIAVLRALGFRRGQVLVMLTAEAQAIGMAGTALGCTLAGVAAQGIDHYRIGGMLAMNVQLDASTVGATLAAAAALSLASTLIPAYRASRANIAQALRSVG